MVGARIANLKLGDNQHTKEGSSQDLPSVSQPQAAKTVNVSVSSLKRGVAVLNSGNKELIKAVDQGKVPVKTAAELVKS